MDETAEIVLFERGDYISFANCGLPYYIGDVIRERENLLVMKAELMAGRFRVDVRVKSEVIAINRTRKTVTVRGGTGEVYEESYDKLVLSTGSAPVIPEIPGIADPNVFTLWNMGDVDRIKAFISVSRQFPEVSTACKPLSSRLHSVSFSSRHRETPWDRRVLFKICPNS